MTYEFGNHPQPQSSLLVGKMYFQLKMLVNRCEKSGFSGRSAFCARCSLAKTQVSDQNGFRLYIINGKHKLEIYNVVLFLQGSYNIWTETWRLKTAQNPPVYQQRFLFTSHFQGMSDIPSPSPATHTLPRCSQQRSFHLSSKVVPLHGRHMTFNASWVWGMARNLALLRWFAQGLVKKQWLYGFISIWFG